MTYKKGILWALGTALVSGLSIYVNKFGVAQVSDPFVYTTLKNSIVAIAFIGAGLMTFILPPVRRWMGVAEAQ